MGGRLIGAYLLDQCHYVGVDPSPSANTGLKKIVSSLGKYCENTSVELYQVPFEDFEYEENYFDIALTSPPYFDVENYEGELTAERRYPQFETWCECFYYPLIKNTYRFLKNGGLFILQVGSQKYPLKDKAFEFGEKVGFEILETRKMKKELGLNNTEEERAETFIIMRK